jgi:hypothetical protein
MMAGCARMAGRRTVVGMAVRETLLTVEIPRTSLEALRNIIDEVEVLVGTTVPLPEKRTERCLELLKAAKALTDGHQRPPTHYLKTH